MYGLRFSTFSNIGPHTDYVFGPDRFTRIDSTVYNKGQFYQNYWGLEPRLSARYRIDGTSSLKGSYNRTFQYLHLASNAAASFPWDLWLPSSPVLKPEIADQVALGYFRNFQDNAFEASAEVYYKFMDNQFDFQDGAQLILNQDIERDFLFGTGQSYGLELFAQKSKGATTGSISYTLARTTRQIEGINEGNPYPATNDRRHDFAIVLAHDFTKRLSAATTFIYYTGAAVTFPAGKYIVDEQIVEYYSARNQYRMPAYHRLDVSVTWDGKNPETRRWKSSWNVSLYNAYGRKNAFSINFRESPDDPGVTEAVKIYLFRWVPSVTYNFSW